MRMIWIFRSLSPGGERGVRGDCEIAEDELGGRLPDAMRCFLFGQDA